MDFECPISLVEFEWWGRSITMVRATCFGKCVIL